MLLKHTRINIGGGRNFHTPAVICFRREIWNLFIYRAKWSHSDTSLFLQLHWSHFLTSYKSVHFTTSICYVYLGGTDRCFHDVLECVPNHPDKIQIIIWPLTCKLLCLQPENNLPGHFSLTVGLWIVQTSLFQICFLSSGLSYSISHISCVIAG